VSHTINPKAYESPTINPKAYENTTMNPKAYENTTINPKGIKVFGDWGLFSKSPQQKAPNKKLTIKRKICFSFR
jgi:hypothetical protein